MKTFNYAEKRHTFGLAASALVVIALMSGCGKIDCGGANGCFGEPSSTQGQGNGEIPCTPVYTFAPPGTFDGDECIRMCYRVRSKCVEEQNIKKETCEHYNRMARLEFGRCVSSGATNCYNSVQNNECSTPDVAGCDTEYRSCYTGCGGMVTNSCEKTGGNGETGSGSATPNSSFPQ